MLCLTIQGVDVGRAQNYKWSTDGCKNSVVPTEAPGMLRADRQVSEWTWSFTSCSSPSRLHSVQALCPGLCTHSPPSSPLLSHSFSSFPFLRPIHPPILASIHFSSIHLSFVTSPPVILPSSPLLPSSPSLSFLSIHQSIHIPSISPW